MSLIVQKYGGTSVADIARIKIIAEMIAAEKKSGKDVVVVVSAMAGETDKLISLAHQVTDEPDDREFDMLLSSGEVVSIALLAMALNSLGYKSESFTGSQVGIITDAFHTRARIKKITADRIHKALKEDKIPVVRSEEHTSELQSH